MNRMNELNTKNIEVNFNYSDDDWHTTCNLNKDKAFFISNGDSVCFSISIDEAKSVVAWLTKAITVLEDPEYGEYEKLRQKYETKEMTRYRELITKFEE